MRTVRVDLDHRSYSILIAPHLLQQVDELFGWHDISKRIFLVSNPAVFELHGQKLADRLERSGFETITIFIPEGERTKNLHTIENIYTFLVAQRADRASTLVALGGGVTGDIVGFVAATYLRGIPYVQIPTTLLAQVDSSVGGKTGVNHPHGKNLIGAFYQPSLVCIDLDTLATLPPRDFRSGVYEIIKYGVIYDSQFFDYLDSNLEGLLDRDGEVLEKVISRCCEIKSQVISQDEREHNLRQILNYGHTFGHALEVVTGFHQVTHGEAVAWGMLAAAALSQELGKIDAQSSQRICRLIKRVGTLPAVEHVSPESLLEAMDRDKKRIGDENVFILVNEIGQVGPHANPSESKVRNAWLAALESA